MEPPVDVNFALKKVKHILLSVINGFECYDERKYKDSTLKLLQICFLDHFCPQHVFGWWLWWGSVEMSGDRRKGVSANILTPRHTSYLSLKQVVEMGGIQGGEGHFAFPSILTVAP